MNAKGIFTQLLWDSVNDIYNKMKTHPFVIQLANGTLPYSCFSHYLSQDILYIKDDAFALETLSKRALDKNEQDFFCAMANDAIEIERELHNDFLTHFKIKTPDKKSPVIKLYTDFLTKHASDMSYSVAASALLPCFWIYNQIGNYIVSKAVPDNVYQKWIDTYKGDEYEAYTLKFIEIVEALAQRYPENKQQMVESFKISTEYELMFFDEAINLPNNQVL